MKSNNFHESVMVREVIWHLNIQAQKKPGLPVGRFIDATLGTGGHTLEILLAGGEVLGIEADQKMLEIAKKRIGSECPTSNYKFVNGNFADIKKIASENGFGKVDGILFDLGVSNLHLKDDNRGFSFDKPDQNLDMRLDTKNQGVKASDLLNVLDQTQLTKLFASTMKYSDAKKLSVKVIENRPLQTVGDFLKLVNKDSAKKNLNPATLPMLALRIAVNSELENLRKVLSDSYDLLKVGGKLLIITFHSGEVEIVKKFKKDIDLVLPSEVEIKSNPRSRSAKLWVIKR